MPIMARAASLRGGNSSAVIALTTLRRAGIPLPGLGVAAAPKRRGLPARLNGMGRVVQYDFYGYPMSAIGVEDELAQVEQGWEELRGNDTGYYDPDLQRSPGACASGLQSLANDICAVTPARCSGIDVSSVISSLCGKYSSWLAAAAPKGPGDAYNYDRATWESKFPGAPWPGLSTAAQYTGVAISAPDQLPAGGGNQTAYSVPNTITPTYGTNPTSGVVNTGGGGSMSTPPASSTGNGTSGPVVVTLRNVSRPSMALASGDSFELVITGPPYSPVSIDATRNGSQSGTSSFGTTDGQGLKIVPGRMSDNEIGSWVETVRVANSAATISFSVGAAPGMAQGGGPAATGSGSSTGGGGGTATGVPVPMPMPEGVIVSGMPSWVVPAAIAAGAFLMLRK